MQTYILYSVVFIIVLMMTRVSQIKNSKKYMIYAAITLTLLAGLRDRSVGIDTQGYTELFDRIAEGQFELAYGLETSFKYICFVLLRIWNNDNFLFFIFALITNVLIFDRLWDFKEYISLPWSATVYFGVFYFMSFNIMRQCVAVAIIFFATRYLYQKKYFKFLLFVFISFLFHKSGLMGVLFVVFEMFVRKQHTKKQIRRFVLFIMFGGIAALGFGAVIFEKYLNYFEFLQLNFGAMLFVKLIAFLLTVSFVSSESLYKKNEDACDVAIYNTKTTKLYYGVGILLTMLGYLFSYMDRVGMCFYIFEILYVSMVMKSKRVDKFIKFAVATLYLIILALTLFGNGQGQGNYIFFWQQV